MEQLPAKTKLQFNVYFLYRLVQPLFRRKRWHHFLSSFEGIAETHILDVGGHLTEWMAGVEVPCKVTFVNIGPFPKGLSGYGRFFYCQADGRSLPFLSKAFTLAYSNSVIEHVGSFEDQRRFAEEIRRVGDELYVQTPNRWFPIEPHFIGLFAHWLPDAARRWLMPLLSIRGWFRGGDNVPIEQLIDEVRLLDIREMRILFPDCEIIRERVFGLTKSLIAIRKRPR